MEEKLYSIGEVSQIMGISVQSLRHYCNIGLITPAYTDSFTGYRYFSDKQLHYIDRTRYLLKCRFSLQEISDILQSDDIDLLIRSLTKKKAEQMQIIKDAVDVLATLDWYRDYFNSAIKSDDSLSYYIKHLPSRSLVAVKRDNSYGFDKFYPKFSEIRSQKAFASLRFKRQFVSIWDCAGLMKGTFCPQYTGMVAFENIQITSENLFELPEGDYYCFKAAILEDDWNPEILKGILAEKGTPKLVLTLELEDSLKEFQHCMHEVQLLF